MRMEGRIRKANRGGTDRNLARMRAPWLTGIIENRFLMNLVTRPGPSLETG
jgi:hypothetical protein